MIVLEFKLQGTARQYQAIDEAIRTTQFIRNKCVRLWQDVRDTTGDDLNRYCRILAQEHAFVRNLNSMARQAAAERAWAAITHFYTDSDGEEKENPHLLRRAEKALRRMGRRVSRKVKGSRNRAKARNRLGRKHLQVQRQRRDFAAKTARALVMSNDVIAYEDLRVANMVQNRHLSKSISDAGWRTFRTWLEYLAQVYSKVVVAVPRTYTTQECSRCGTLVRKMMSERTHVCPKCGLVSGRDHNAGINI